MANGWTGNILRVNLTTGNITLEDSSKFKSFVGGMEASASGLIPESLSISVSTVPDVQF